MSKISQGRDGGVIYQHQTVDSLNGDKSRGIIHSNFRRPLYTLKDKMLSNYVDGFLLCTHNIARQSCKVFDMNKNKLGAATSKLSHKTINDVLSAKHILAVLIVTLHYFL